MLPVDLLDDQQVAGIDVHAFRPTQVRQITPFDVRLKSIARDLCDAFDVVESQAPTLVRMEAQVVQASVNRVRGSMQVAREFGARNQPHAFAEVPVFQLAPGLLTPADIDARCRPSLAEGVEVAQNRVQRRIRSPGTRTTATTTMPTCELVPVLGRCRSDGAILVETAQASHDPYAGPPRASKGPPRRRRMHALR